jgi:hypothetical protein
VSLEDLSAKVDAFAASAASGGQLACRRGCSACCEVELTVSPLEAERVDAALAALPVAALAAVRARVDDPPGRCVMLGPEGACAVYEARPLVCRSQGLALRYPAGTMRPDAVRAEAEDGSEVTWCPLNYRERPPAPSEVLDAERVDVLLALLTRRDRPHAPRRALREVVASHGRL